MRRDAGDGAWNREAETVLFQDPPGVGKTHLGVRAIQLGFSAQHYRFDELMTALRERLYSTHGPRLAGNVLARLIDRNDPQLQGH